MSLPQYLFKRVAGDIQEQMDGVLALAEQLARQPLSAEARACVDGVIGAADGVRRTLTTAVALRTITQHGLTLEPAPLRLRDLMDQIQARWRVRAGQNDVTVLVSYDGDPDACVMADGGRLQQVFDGFVGEAAAAIRGGAVEASLRAVSTDGGVSIWGRVRGARDVIWASEDLESRVREMDARFGLEVALGGLLSRRILAELSGDLQSETNAGAGETISFDLLLPAAAEAPAPPQEAPARAAHVLVVDDNATNRMVAQALVEMFGCTCACACDGLEAVEAASQGRFDLILMDIKMPRMDGVTAARAIRALEGAVSQVPIIALTANADPDDAAGYLSAGMNGVVEKPMKPENLLAALRDALDPARATAAAA
jgi:CheY-like chemotaxis protein